MKPLDMLDLLPPMFQTCTQKRHWYIQYDGIDAFNVKILSIDETNKEYKLMLCDFVSEYASRRIMDWIRASAEALGRKMSLPMFQDEIRFSVLDPCGNVVQYHNLFGVSCTDVYFVNSQGVDIGITLTYQSVRIPF